MNKLSKIGSTIAIVSLLMPSLVFAEDGTSTNQKIETIKDKIQQRMEDAKENEGDHKLGTTTGTSTATTTNIQDKIKKIKDDAEKKKEDIQNGLKNRISNFMDNLFRRYDAAIDRFTKLSSRIQSRITKIEAEGIDESKSKALLVTANAKIDAAKLAIANLHSIATSTVATSTDLKTTFASLKDAIKSVDESLRGVQSALVDVVKNIKPGKNKEDKLNDGEATSTATTTQE